MKDLTDSSSIAEHSMDESTSQFISDLQKTILDVFEETIRIFDKYNLKYSLVAGTLLGAIRHKGFIPWDDDLDIIMPREDFEKFRNIAAKDLKENFFFQDYTTDSEYPSLYAKVRNSQTTLIENGYRNLKQMNHGVFIDVFVADKYKETLKNKIRKRIIKICSLILLYQKIAGANPFAKVIAKLFPRKPLFRLAEKISTKINCEKDTNKYIMLNQYIMPDGIFDELIDVPFENLNVKISAKYDEMLTDMFGDYMKLPPMEKRKPKHITKWFSLSVPYKEYIKNNL